MPQGAEEVDGGAGVGRFETLGGHALEDVASGDVLLHLRDHALVFSLGGVADRRRKLIVLHRGEGLQGLDSERRAELGDD